MPRRLLERTHPDSIREFQAAARERYNDALAMAGCGRRTGAMYLWGYTAEMVIKAAYFSLIGIAETHPLSWSVELRGAINRGRTQFHIAWPPKGEGHNVRAWAELLIAARAISTTTAYSTRLALDVQSHGQRIGQLWTETLRYRKNFAYIFEMRQVRQAAEWFLVNSSQL